MARPPLEVADLIRAAGDAFIERNRHWLRWKHIKVLLAIRRCRTAALGGHLDECTRCGYRAAISYNSCRNRHCPSVRSLHGNAGSLRVDENCFRHATYTWSSHSPAAWLFWSCRTRKSSTISCSVPVRKLFAKWHAIRNVSARKLASSACCIPGAKNSKFIRMFIVSFLPAASRLITPAGFAHETTTFFPRKCCVKFFAASSSTLSNRLFTMASSTSRET